MNNEDFLKGYKLGIMDFKQELNKLNTSEQQKMINNFYLVIENLLIDKATLSIKLNDEKTF